MPTTKKNITEMARDFAEGAELDAAIQAKAPVALTQDESREHWARRWVDLSEWARSRELSDLDREIEQTLAELRLALDAAEQEATEAMYAGGHAQSFFCNVVGSQSPQSTNDIDKLFADTMRARDYAQRTATIAASLRLEYTEAKGIVALAQMRAQHAQRHFTEVRRVRVRAVASTIVVTLLLLLLSVLLMHFRMRHLQSSGPQAAAGPSSPVNAG